LALWQTNWVCDRLREAHPSLEIEQIIIKTHGDVVQDKNFGREWPVGAFVSALENALLEDRIDFAVHSFKDLQTAETGGLTIAATPPRAAVHDVLLTRESMRLEDLPEGGRIGTNSPRRAAQLLQMKHFEIVPIRGNVPTRIKKIQRENLVAVMLAAAGLDRLGIEYPHRIDLPPEQFLPAPAQGSLAVQARDGDEAADVASVLDDANTRRGVMAERCFLRRINAGCHTPVGALGRVDGDGVRLRARLFSDDYKRAVEGDESGGDPETVGYALADRLLAELRSGK
jgi:hydroxymethylbilane synthase